MATADPDRTVVIVDGRRTPFLKTGTDFVDMRSYDLGRFAIQGLLGATKLDPQVVDRVIMGTVISNVQTSNVARECLLGAGLSKHTPAMTVTQACISANAAICAGADLIRTGQAEVVIAGGTECMSDVPIRFRKKVQKRLLASQKFKGIGDWLKALKGLKFKDLLPEVPAVAEFSTGRTMGQDCDRLAARLGISREAQDAFALESHQKAGKAWDDGVYDDEVTAVRLEPKYRPIDRDNGFRPDSTPEQLAKLRPAFVKRYGTITAANASFLTDGAAVSLLMSESAAKRLGYQPLAYLRHYLFVAQDPMEELLLGPAYAIAKIFQSTGLSLDDFGVFELHEAFAGQVLANLKCLASADFSRDILGLDEPVGEIPADKLNRHGGSLSLGHPFGATGSRLVTTAANRLHREDARYALIAACAAGAQGHAAILERYAE